MSTPERTQTLGVVRPADFCRQLLGAMEASDGRRMRRKRNTRPDAIGLGIKRDLLERAVLEDPEPDEFELWLFEQGLNAGTSRGAVRAMAVDIFYEWQLTAASDEFKEWLDHGAPSDDAAR